MEEEEVGGRQQILMALRETELKDENLLDTYFDLIIDSYDHAGNYLILLFHDNYDVNTRTKDNLDLDESEEVFSYLLCAICPVDLSKPALGYREEEQRIASRIQDWVVGAPDTGFLFPAFNDRSTDIHSCLFYTKNTKEPHSEFMANGLGCPIEHTATEQKMAFHSILRSTLGPDNEGTETTILDIQQNINDKLEEYKEFHDEDEDVEPLLLDKEKLSKILTECKVSDEHAQRIEEDLEEAFGEKMPSAEYVVDAKALSQNALRLERMELHEQVDTLTRLLDEKNTELDSFLGEEKTCEIVLHVKSEKAAEITSRIIDGQKYMLIPMDEDENASINGVTFVE